MFKAHLGWRGHFPSLALALDYGASPSVSSTSWDLPCQCLRALHVSSWGQQARQLRVWPFLSQPSEFGKSFPLPFSPTWTTVAVFFSPLRVRFSHGAQSVSVTGWWLCVTGGLCHRARGILEELQEGRVPWCFCRWEAGIGFAGCVFILYNRSHTFPYCLYMYWFSCLWYFLMPRFVYIFSVLN